MSLGGFEPSTLGVGNLRSNPLSYKLNILRFLEDMAKIESNPQKVWSDRWTGAKRSPIAHPFKRTDKVLDMTGQA